MLLRKKESQDLKQSDLMQQQKIDQLMSNLKRKKKKKEIQTPAVQSLLSFVSLLSRSHLPTFPSLWSVLGSAMMA